MEILNLVTTADGLDESTNDTTDESAMNLETTTTVLSGSKLQCLLFLMAPLRNESNYNRRVDNLNMV